MSRPVRLSMGCLIAEWKAKHQQEANREQVQAYAARQATRNQ